jgi:predicted metal-dependent peptidase
MNPESRHPLCAGLAEAPPASCPGDLAILKARLFRARASLVEESPFLGSLVLKVPILITEDPRVQSACVDGRGVCYFGRAFLEALPLPALRVVLLHEALHLALEAFPRCGSRRPLRWNVAHDFAINLLIGESAFGQDFLSMPDAFQPLLDPKFKGLAAEEIYERLPLDLGVLGLSDRDCVRDAIEGMGSDEKAALGKALLTDFRQDALGADEWALARRAAQRFAERLRGPLPDLGPGQEGEGLAPLRRLFPAGPGGAGFGDLWFDAWTALTEAERDAMRESWREKLLEAAEQALQGERGIGSLPGWARKLLGPLLNPQIPWQVKLAQKVHGHLRGCRRSFSRPGRRSQAVGAVLPGPIRDRGPVGVFVDVSGSVGPAELGAFMGELVGILQNADLPVRLITWDAAVQEDLLLEHPEDMEAALGQGGLALVGGGGTDPRCVIGHLAGPDAEDLPPLSFGVLLTDGYVPWPRASDWPFELLVVCSAVLPDPTFGYDALMIDPGANHD